MKLLGFVFVFLLALASAFGLYVLLSKWVESDWPDDSDAAGA